MATYSITNVIGVWLIVISLPDSSKTKSRWDAHSIKAEIHRRGETLSGIASKKGLHESTCRAALLRSQPEGERVIAQFLCVPLYELWPDRWDEAGEPIHRIGGEPNHERDEAHRLNAVVR